MVYVRTPAIGELVRSHAEAVGLDTRLVVVPLPAVLDDLKRARGALRGARGHVEPVPVT